MSYYFLLKKTTRCIFFISFYFFITACSSNIDGSPRAGQVMVVSVSSNGNYVISSNDSKKIILWDIKNKTKKIISRNGNIYSAYFIRGTDLFMWQDLNDIVHIQNVNGEQILSFKNIPTYGQVMTSDLKHYISSDVKLGVYDGYGNRQKQIKEGFEKDGFWSSGKLLNLNLSTDNKFLVTSGYAGLQGDDLPLSDGYKASDVNPKIWSSADFSLLNGVVLWDVDTGKPIFKFSGDQTETVAAISPDAKYIVSGDQEGLSFIWDVKTGKKIYRVHQVVQNPKMPQDFADEDGAPTLNIFGIKFIDMQNHYLRFNTGVPYAVLYSVTNPNPLKYLPLGKFPWPGTVDYSRDGDIDTAPAANILVMAQQNGPGIIVYKYDPTTQTLKKIWAPEVYSQLLKQILLSFIPAAIAVLLLLRWRPALRMWVIIFGFLAIPIALLIFNINLWDTGISLSSIAAAMIIFGLLCSRIHSQ